MSFQKDLMAIVQGGQVQGTSNDAIDYQKGDDSTSL